MTPRQKLTLTRRAFAAAMTGTMAALGLAEGAAATGVPDAAIDKDLRDAALRGLARAGDRGDTVLAARADAVLARLEATDPEASLLVQIYRRFDVASASYWYGDTNDNAPATSDLAVLHDAVHDCQPISFHYTDLQGEETARAVLPIVIVHPPQGVKLLAWCAMRRKCRQFFVRSMRDLNVEPGSFRADRLTLLREVLHEVR